MHSHLDTARRAARAGGDILMRYFRQNVATTAKDPAATYNLVSEADLQSEQAVVRMIREAFPEHAVFAEESHQDDVSAEHLWVIDPLDGTNNFIHGIDHFAISIAYYHAGQAVCGVIFNPARDDWYEVVRGQGAQHNGQPARVSAKTQLDEVLVGVGFYYD
ncbi:MAG: inositol monophosphatase, partial [Pirellulales bacterium]|nr:inositol monophosphatase [Pirellulales bacterium]